MSQALQVRESLKILSQQKGQSIPSLFSLNPQYFNNRLVRIKQKVDQLIKQNIASHEQYKQSFATLEKKETINEEQRSTYQTVHTVQTNHTSHGRVRELLPADKIVGSTKDKIKGIYNQIHLLQSVAMKDQSQVQTNTFELRSFLKDLRMQSKRLTRILPQSVLFEIEKEKTKSFKKSEIIFNQTDRTKSVETEIKSSQKQQMQSAKKMIEDSFLKRKIFNQKQKYYEDKQMEKNSKCKLCQII